MTYLFRPLLCLVLTLVTLGARAEGSLVIVGGALRADNAAVWQRIVDLAGGKGARIAVVPAAAGNPTGSGGRVVQHLNQYGAQAFLLPLAPRLPGDVHVAANDPANVAALQASGGVYFIGGDQARITASLRNVDGANSKVLDAIWALYHRGGVVAGASAGAAIMSSTMFDNAGTTLSLLQNGVSDGTELAPGLGFIGKDVFVDQHLIIRGRFARMLPAMLKKSYKRGLGIDENTAVVVGPGRDAEVIGYKGAIWFDLTNATVDPNLQAFNIANASISYLDHGDRINLDTGAMTPSADKVGGKVDPAKPGNRSPLFSADILGNTTLVDLMSKLVDSSQPQATGLAFGGPDANPALPGFSFQLRRTDATVGYESATSEAYSVYRMRLDVKPVKVRWPAIGEYRK
ncbi:cyanophycinase [Massilia sp. S19_KUP03_FR1]|uniref:cyanophycinase n=1 Tax=Massilia sp. S19_KUP03_FR1 TaxID=3025503 RepID=UPI002FCD0DD4